MLYRKKWKEGEVSLENSLLLTEGCLKMLKLMHADSYHDVFCLEASIINKIKNNLDNFFDFSKGMIDVGASIGEYPICLSFNINYIFEPDKESLWTCHANLVNFDKIQDSYTYDCALSDTEGEDTIFTNGSDKWQTVKTKTLDSFGFKNIGFIKIDVEGFEEKVIRGGLLTIISNNYPPILFECWPVGYWGMTQEKHDSLFNLLKTLGYEIFEQWGDFETHLAIHKTQL